MFDTAGFEGVPNLFVCDESNAFMKSIVAVHIFDSPLVAFLVNHSVHRKMVCYLVRASESRLIFRLILVESRIQPAEQYCREQFVQRWQRTDRAEVSNIFHISFFVYHFHSHLLPCLWWELVLLYDFD